MDKIVRRRDLLFENNRSLVAGIGSLVWFHDGNQSCLCMEEWLQNSSEAAPSNREWFFGCVLGVLSCLVW